MGEPTRAASVPSLWSGTSARLQARRARPSVSRTVGSLQPSPSARAAPRRWPTSKRALWATSTVDSPSRRAQARKAVRASPTGGAPATMALVMPVRTVIWAGMARPGFTRVDISDSTAPPRTRTAPISVMASAPGGPPVVSRSTTTKTTSLRGVPIWAKEACTPGPGGEGAGETTWEG